MSGGRLLTKLRHAMGWVADDDDLARGARREQAAVDLRNVTDARRDPGDDTDGGHDDG